MRAGFSCPGHASPVKCFEKDIKHCFTCQAVLRQLILQLIRMEMASSTHYRLASDEGALLLRDWKGRRYSDDSSPRWNAIKAVESPGSYRVLLKGEGSGAGTFRMLGANSAASFFVSNARRLKRALKGDGDFIDHLPTGRFTSIRMVLPGDGDLVVSSL